MAARPRAAASSRNAHAPPRTPGRTQLGATVDALALAAVIAQPFEPMVLSGAAAPDQLRSNFGAVALAARVDRELLERLRVEVAQAPGEYWGDRGALAWN